MRSRTRLHLRLAPLLACAFALLSAQTTAQTAPGPSAAAGDAADSSKQADAVQMSPFEVQTTHDTGYAAQNTLSGSRLNTSLADTPAAISVFTPQFMQDIGATDVIDLVQYSVNTDSDLLTGGNQGLAVAGEDPIISIRGISAGRGGLYTNFFPSAFVQDTYNLERAELTRGPNSVLYGIGLPAGGYNVTTKKADVRRQIYNASFRFGSYNQARGTIDANVPVVPGKLALRLNAVA
jgi:outer membrane receptor protein involved in Fe transport